MKKIIIFLFFVFIFLFLNLDIFAQTRGLINIGDILSRTDKRTINYVRDVTAQIALRESEIRANDAEIKYNNLQIIRIIEKNNLTHWERLWNAEIKEYNRQNKDYENKNKNFQREINRLFRELKRSG